MQRNAKLPTLAAMLSAVITFAIVLLVGGAAYAADLAKWQAETMTLGGDIVTVNQADDEGSAIKWVSTGPVARNPSVTTSGGADSVVVRAKGTQSGGSPELALMVKDNATSATIAAQVGAEEAVTTTAYTEYTFPWNAPPGSYQIGLKGKNIATGRQVFVDYMRVVPAGAAEPPPPIDTDGDGVADDVDQCDTQAGPSSNQGCPVSTLPLHSAASAADYSNSVGMATHIAFRSTPYYSQFPETKAALAELGIKHIRDGAAPNMPTVSEKYAELKRDLGIGVELTLHEDEIGAASQAEVTNIINTVGGNAGGAVEVWEGINEYNRTNETGGNPDWGAELKALQTKLYNAVQNSRYDLPVACPSIQNPYPPMGEIPRIPGACDYRLKHSYPGGGGVNPDSEKLLGEDIVVANHVAGNSTAPLISSETGWSTADGAFQETNDVTKAKYTTRLSPVYFNHGIMRVHQYQLYDHFVGTSAQAHFGLLRNNFSETPAYRALENQLDIVGEYSDHAPTGLRYDLEGESADVQTLLLQKANGDYYLLIWQEVLSYDRVSDTSINVPAENVTVRFDSAKNVAVFTPRTIASSGDADNAETHPDRTLTGVTSVTEPIEDEVNIIRIR